MCALFECYVFTSHSLNMSWTRSRRAADHAEMEVMSTVFEVLSFTLQSNPSSGTGVAEHLAKLCMSLWHQYHQNDMLVVGLSLSLSHPLSSSFSPVFLGFARKENREREKE